MTHDPLLPDALLRADDAVKDFGPNRALAGVSLSIAPGESVAIMGPSGSGRSTLLHCLSGVLVPDHGTVTYQGEPFSSLPDAQRSHLRLRDFGFVFQDGQLLPELPARDNVALPALLTGTKTAAALRDADIALERLGLADLRHRRPPEMSGGQAQRVAIARALAGSARVLFADEPTGALDQATGHETMQLLTTAAAQSSAALVLVTHDRAVTSWCSRIVELRDGLVHAEHHRQDADPVAPVRSAGVRATTPSPTAGSFTESAR